MRTVRRRSISFAPALSLPLGGFALALSLPLGGFALALSLPLGAVAAPAPAFQVGASPDFPGCNIWLNDKGQPLRNKLGREIAQEVPCAGQSARHDTYKTVPGDKPGTLLIRDETHNLECLMALAPGSATVIVPKACRPIDR